MRDFCNVAEKDCVRLIIAQDLKEFGIDVDTNLGGGLGNLTAPNNTSRNSHALNLINTSSNLNGTSHFHNNSMSHHCHTTLGSNLKELISSSKNHNKSNISTNLIDHTSNGTTGYNPHDSHLAASTRIFNINLNQLELVPATVLEQTLNVPIFLKYSVDFLNELIHIEGIFRRNGTASRLKELKKQVEEGIYNFEKFAIFDVTSLFKQFFRELPESLLTFALYSNFIQAVKLETTKSKLESILNLCLQLPELNLNVLIYVMNFLKRVTLQESTNKMNSFNLAVCFAPNIIYTKVNKCNDLYINEERIVVQLLIENSSSIGKISDSVYERSLMLNSLCCSTTMMNVNNTTSLATANSNNILSTTVDCAAVVSNVAGSAGSNPSASVSMNINSSAKQSSSSTTMVNSDLLFLYDNDLQENSFAHHGQSAGSTSLSSYCGSSSSTSKKEKKKRRSSSLKELMNTIQNSISKFRRRSASEKNDKTTCSIITCSSMGNGISAISNTGAGDLSCTSRICYDEKQRFLCDSQTPYIGGSSAHKQMLATPMCASLYATPRINKRNAEDSLQSTTKKLINRKLMEKLPQRNLLLPNAPITPFSTTKKSKHPFKQLLSTSEATCSSSASKNSNGNTSQQPVIVGKSSKSTDELSTSSKVVNLVPLTPQATHKNNPTTPSTLTTQNVNANTNQNPTIINLQKQLKYDESPSSSLKHKLEKDSSSSSHDCRRRLEMLPSSKHHTSSCSSSTSSSSSSKHHHHHHHHHHSHQRREHREHHREHRDHHREHRDHHRSEHHHHSSSSKNHHHHHHRSGNSNNTNNCVQQHHYVNAIPSPSSRYSSSNRYINQSDLCTKIISGNYIPAVPIKSKTDSLSSSSSSSSSEQHQHQNQKFHNHTSACCGAENSKLAAERSAIDNSMRCTLRRGRPNTPKTGLSVDYRIRKSSVPNTPECTHLISSRVNHTISSDDYKLISGEDLKKNLNSYLQQQHASNTKIMGAKQLKSKSNVVVNLSTSSLNTAMVADDDLTGSRSNLKSTTAADTTSLNESATSRLLDMAFNEDDIEDSDLEDNNESKNPSNITTTTTTSSCSLSKAQKSRRKLSKSLSLSNLPDSSSANRMPDSSPINTTSVSDSSTYPVIKKSISSDSLPEAVKSKDIDEHDYHSEGEHADEKRNEMNSNENLMKAISLDEKPLSKTELISENRKTTKNKDEAVSVVIDNKSSKEALVTPVAGSEPKLGEETFKFKIPESLEDDEDNMLQNVLRRQSLFKLKEKINGKVSKQISEIEQRKLSPYRFSNSPLKQKKSKEHGTSNLISKQTVMKRCSDLPVSKLTEIPEEQYVVKSSDKLSTTIATSTIKETESEHVKSSFVSNPGKKFDKPFRKIDQNQTTTNVISSPFRAAANKFFYKKFNRNRNVKRLNATTQATGSPFTEDTENCPNRSLQVNSPTGKRLVSDWKCSNETVNL